MGGLVKAVKKTLGIGHQSIQIQQAPPPAVAAETLSTSTNTQQVIGNVEEENKKRKVLGKRSLQIPTVGTNSGTGGSGLNA